MTAAQRAHLKQQIHERQRRVLMIDKRREGPRVRNGPHAPKGYGRRYAA